MDLAERALAIDPGFVSALAILGHLYLHVDRLEQALEYSDRALGLDPDHAYANAARSDYYLQGTSKNAIFAHRRFRIGLTIC